MTFAARHRVLSIKIPYGVPTAAAALVPVSFLAGPEFVVLPYRSDHKGHVGNSWRAHGRSYTNSPGVSQGGVVATGKMLIWITCASMPNHYFFMGSVYDGVRINKMHN